MKYDTVIFDLDGTLLNTLSDIADSVNAALSATGLPVHPVESYRRFVGNGLEKLIRRSVALPAGEDEMLKVMALYRREYARRFLDKTLPYDGIAELVSRLSDGGVRLAVVTNKIEQMSRDLCDKFFPGRFGMVYGELPGRVHKPDPATVLSVISAFGAEKSRTLFVGDSDVDMQTARNAGISSVGVLWGFCDENELAQNNPTFVASSPADVFDYINDC